MGVISIAAFLKEVIKMHRVSIPENIELQLDVRDEDLKIKGDVNQLQQVIMNLMNNARDAVEGAQSPEIKISMHAALVTAKEERTFPKLKGRKLIQITVSDNGSGIKQNHLKKVFEPFFTTKPEGKGTGLGLAMAYGAVKTHGGWIFVAPAANGIGTTVSIYLPMVEESVDHSHQKWDDRVVEGEGETILLVDDNQMVLEVSQELLEGLNYQVITARDGLEAVEIFSARGSEIDMLLLDVVMPRLGGMEALKQIRQINPNVKALFATGYNKATAVSACNEFQSERIISKPFAISELSQEIRNQLSS